MFRVGSKLKGGGGGLDFLIRMLDKARQKNKRDNGYCQTFPKS